MKKINSKNNPDVLNKNLTNTIKDGTSIKKERQLKSTILVAISTAVLVVVCVLFLVLSLGQENNPPPKDRYMDINAVSGSHHIKIADIVNDTQIVTEFSTFESRQYIEVIGENSDIFCFADGTILSIEHTQDNGSIVTIEHIPGMYSVYTYVELNENLEVGTDLTCGENIGIMHQQETTILRFEINLDGKNIDPTPYVTK